MSEDPRIAAVAKALRDLGGPFSDIDHEQMAERFIAMEDALQQATDSLITRRPPTAPITAGADPPWLDKAAQMAMCAWCPYGMLPPMDNDHYWDSWRNVVRAVHAFIAAQVVSSQIDAALAEGRREAIEECVQLIEQKLRRTRRADCRSAVSGCLALVSALAKP